MESDEEETVLRHNCGNPYADYERTSDRRLNIAIACLLAAGVCVLIITLTAL